MRTNYTHQMISDTQEGKQSVPIGWIARKRRELKADYMNRQYGFALSPSLSGGAMLIKLMSKLRVSIDYWMRHLPAPANEGERLLDVGCANGSFLSGAKRLGYDNWGLEPDPKSADFARRLGFTVQVGGLPNSGLPKGSFAQITLDHVFEHLHYSLDALREINTLLKPGGRLWVTVSQYQ